MNLKSSTYEELANFIRTEKKRVVVYGAGMIGQIVVPYIIRSYGLEKFVDCYVDMDERKRGKCVSVGEYRYAIKSPEILDNASENTVILLTNSKFYSVVDYLEQKDSLRNVDCYIIPIMQKDAPRAMIPKVIHYCWFGGKEIPDSLKKCMESWRELCPDYEIKRWDESSFNVKKYDYTRQAFERGKYGFVSDMARLDILYNHGGIYLDTDVKLLKPLDSFLYNKGFVGTEKWGNINSGGGMGAVPQHPMIKEMIEYRNEFPFVYKDGTLNIETNGLYETVPFIRHGYKVDNSLQVINDMTVYPASVFHPYDYMSCQEKIEEDTVSIHYFSGGWMDEADRENRVKTNEKYGDFLARMDLS